jgi:hypothetical protein
MLRMCKKRQEEFEKGRENGENARQRKERKK